MRRWLVVVICAALAAILTGGARYRTDRSRRYEAARLRTENDRLRWQISQWYSGIPASAKVALTASPIVSAAPMETRNQSSATESPGAVRRTDVEFHNAGRATPIDALLTLAWACDNADAKTVEGLVILDDAARAKALAFMSRLPPNLQAQWTSPEVAAADALVDRVKQRPFPLPRVLALARVEEMGPDRVKLRLPDTNYDDMDFRRMESGWAYAITEAEVDQFIDEHAPRKR